MATLHKQRDSSSLTLKQKLIVPFLSVLLALLIVEIGIRVSDAFVGKGFFSNHRNPLAESSKFLYPFRTFGVELYQKRDGVRYISSRHGELYPLEKPQDTFRIVCFGGSTTENIVNGVHYPLILQSILRERLGKDNIEVINVGYSAYATPHSLILLELDVLSWDPDLVILSHNINDLTAMYWPDFTFDYSNKYSHRAYNIPDLSWADFAFQYFQIYWILQENIEKLYWYIKFRVSDPYSLLQRKSYGNRPNPEAIEVFERNLQSFITLAKSNNIQVMLSTQPLQPNEEYFVAHMAYKSYNSIIVYPLHGEFVKHHFAFNEIIRKTAEGNEVWFIDNNQLMAGKEKYFTDFVHYSKLGLEQLAQNYADFIVDNKIIRRKTWPVEPTAIRSVYLPN